MNKVGVLSVLVIGGLALTGCATSIEDVGPEDGREVQDQVYAEHLEASYGEEFPDLDETVAIDYSLRLCSVLDARQVVPADLDDWLDSEGLEGRDRVAFADMMYWGVKVYCPENLGDVDHLKSVTV